MKKTIIALSLLLSAAAHAQPPREAFVDSLLATMTIQERIGQLNLASSWGFRSALSGNSEAGAGSVMTSFNDFEEIPATCNPWLIDTLLRKQWGFKGFVVTDANAIKETIAHGMGDLQRCSARALQAGVDMDMNSNGFIGTLLASLGEGKVSEREINEACRRVLLAKYDAGLFADPYRRLGGSGKVFTAETRAFARRAAQQSQVLLKNNGVLPLRKDAKILLVGPLADRADDMLGCWNITSHKGEAVTLRQGMENAAPHHIIYREGSWLVADSLLEKTLRTSLLGFLDPNYKPEAVHQRPLQAMIDEAVAAAAEADVIVAAVGESNSMNGEGASRADITIPAPQRQLLRALKATGKPVVLALFTGRPLVLDWEDANLDAILCLWALGDQGGAAAADVLYGDVNPQGRLTTSWPQAVGQCPIYYNHKTTGRPWPDDAPYQKFTSCYIDTPNGPQYPFGYGLSYTEFKYGDIAASDTTLTARSPLTLTLPVENTGKRGGVATVQLYIHAVASSSTRPVKELKAFKQVAIAAGETAKVSFTLTQEDLRHYNHDLQPVCEPGAYEIFIGSSSRDTQKIVIHAL